MATAATIQAIIDGIDAEILAVISKPEEVESADGRRIKNQKILDLSNERNELVLRLHRTRGHGIRLADVSGGG